MINRRYLRIKVMQALYALFQSEDKDLLKGERALLKGINSIYDLYIYQLAFFLELKHVATVQMEEAKKKRLPTESDLNPNLKFIENKFLEKLAINQQLANEIQKRKISWNNEFELVRKILNIIKESKEYESYLTSNDDSFDYHASFFADIFKYYISDHEILNHLYEEKNMYWGDDLFIVNPMSVSYTHLRAHETR